MPFLPAPQPVGPAPARHASFGGLPLQGLTVLVVDDSRFACDALRLILSRAGARMRRCETIEAARRHLACYRPDLAVVDLGLPDGRGEELIAELSGQGFPVLGLSGDPAGRQAALAAGATGFLEKPVGSAGELVQLLRALVAPIPAEGVETTALMQGGDRTALRDDLKRAADLVQTRGDPGYALAFLQSLARDCGDMLLEEAARSSTTPFDRARLARMIDDRVSALMTRV